MAKKDFECNCIDMTKYPVVYFGSLEFGEWLLVICGNCGKKKVIKGESVR